VTDPALITAATAAKERAEGYYEAARQEYERAWREMSRAGQVAHEYHKAWLAVMAAPDLPAEDYDGCAL